MEKRSIKGTDPGPLHFSSHPLLSKREIVLLNFVALVVEPATSSDNTDSVIIEDTDSRNSRYEQILHGCRKLTPNTQNQQFMEDG